MSARLRLIVAILASLGAVAVFLAAASSVQASRQRQNSRIYVTEPDVVMTGPSVDAVPGNDAELVLGVRSKGKDISAGRVETGDGISLVARDSHIPATGLTMTTITATLIISGVPQNGVPVVFSTTVGSFENWRPSIVVTTAGGAAVTWLRSAHSGTTVTAVVRVSATLAFTETSVVFDAVGCDQDYSAFLEYPVNPVFDPPETVYYPSSIYDAGSFRHQPGDVISPSLTFTYVVAPYYKNWTARSNPVRASNSRIPATV